MPTSRGLFSQDRKPWSSWLARAARLSAISSSRGEIPSSRTSFYGTGRGSCALEVLTPLPETVSLFPSPLLDSALTKMRAAANDALVQRTLHPPRIPRKPAVAERSAGSSSTGSRQASFSGARPAQKHSSTSSPSGQSGKKRKSRKGKSPFSSSSGGSGCSGGKGKGAGKKSARRDVSPVESGGLPGSALEAVAGDRSGVLGRDRSPGRLPCSLHRLSSSPFLHPGIVSDVPGRLSLGSSLAARGRGDACQRSLRNRPRSGSWLLQSSLPCGEGVWRPVIDLSHLNEFVQLTRFKMETVTSVLLSVREGDFLASLDLKDAYFQIPIHPSSRKLLTFTWEGTAYQLRALCFGLSTAPQVFTRVFAAVSEWAHSHGIRLIRYLDNWLVLASSERDAKQAIQSLLSLCRTLGIVINKKSDLVPSQTEKYLGMIIDTEAGKFFLSLARVEKFLTVAESFCTMDAPPAQLWQVILGHLASLKRLVPHGLLRVRSLQWHLKAHWSPESDPPSLPVPLPREVRRDLSWLMVRDHLLTEFDSGHLLRIFACIWTCLVRGGALTSSIIT